MSHCGLIGLMKHSPVHILNVSGNLLHRSRNVPSPTDAGRTPSASCLGGRSLVLRSLRPASSGSANIIHVIVSCCALFSFVLFCGLSGGGGVPCALFTCGADCPLVAVMRAFFFITRPLAFSWHGGRLWHASCGARIAPIRPSLRSGRTGVRPFLFFNVLFPAINLRRREPPPTL